MVEVDSNRTLWYDYFAYGSNMDQEQMRDRIESTTGTMRRCYEMPPGRLKVVSGAFINGWKLVFNKQGADGSGKANMENANDTLYGILYKIDSNAKNRLECFEVGYHEFPLDVHKFGDTLHTDAQTFIADKDKIRTNLKPKRKYRDHLLRGEEYLTHAENSDQFQSGLRRLFSTLRTMQTFD